jgi:hypothetical protein
MKKQIKIKSKKYSQEIISFLIATSPYIVQSHADELMISRKDGIEPVLEDFLKVIDDIKIKVELEKKFHPLREIIIRKAFGN